MALKILHFGKQKYFENIKICCWRRMKKISWDDRVRNEVLHRLKARWDFLRTMRQGRLIGLVTSCIGIAL